MQTFPEDIQCILQPNNGRGGIYVSNVEAAENPITLKRHGIEAVITAIKGRNLDKVIPQHVEYMYVPAVDHENFDISYYFQEANKFIDEERKRTNVLVHCMAGVSRSVSLVIAYMIKHCGKTYNQAYNFVKSRRSIIHPNSAFIAQLQDYEAKIRQGSSSTNKELSIMNGPSKIVKSNSVGKPVFENSKFLVNYDEALKQNIRMIMRGSFTEKHNKLGDSKVKVPAGSNGFR